MTQKTPLCLIVFETECYPDVPYTKRVCVVREIPKKENWDYNIKQNTRVFVEVKKP